MSIKKDFLISKRNILNELRSNNMTLQELRFFSIYLSKVNPNDTSTRIVRFPLTDFQKIMELGKMNINHFISIADSLLSKTVKIPTERGGLTVFQLFKECKIDLNNDNEWYVEIDAHDKALPLMFEFKDKYFSYQLWNALRLKSSNQLRMYEILKQYEKIGERIISVDELKELLGINKHEYPRYGDFNLHVLKVCQESLKSNTDIKFTYEPTGKRGKGGKILNLKFTIKKNNNYTDQLTLDEFLGQQQINNMKNVEPAPPDKVKERFDLLSDMCNNEFSHEEIQILINIARDTLPPDKFYDDLKLANFFKDKYDELKLRSKQTKIHKPFNYLKTLFNA